MENIEHMEKPHGVVHYPKVIDRGSPSPTPGLKRQDGTATYEPGKTEMWVEDNQRSCDFHLRETPSLRDFKETSYNIIVMTSFYSLSPANGPTKPNQKPEVKRVQDPLWHSEKDGKG